MTSCNTQTTGFLCSRRPTGFTRFELDHLHLWGARVGVEVTIITEGPHFGDESAYIGREVQTEIWAFIGLAGHCGYTD
jgi:hypothetical protein